MIIYKNFYLRREKMKKDSLMTKQQLIAEEQKDF